MTSIPKVPTVRGPVAVADLGTVLMYEHVFVLTEEIRQSLPETWDEQQRVDDAVTRLKALAATGVSTIVDPTVIGLGRDIARIARVNSQVEPAQAAGAVEQLRFAGRGRAAQGNVLTGHDERD